MQKLPHDAFRPGDHILGMFHHENELDYALAFLKHGLEVNEAVLLITDIFPKDELRMRISKEWELDDLEALEANGDVMIKTPQELLFPHGTFLKNSKSLIWKDLTDLALKKGKAGLSIFVDVSPMFKQNLDRQVFKFEKSLDSKFDFPCTIVCAYTYENLKGLGKETYRDLRDHHNHTMVGE